MADKMKRDEALQAIAYLQEMLDSTRVRAAYSYPYFFGWALVWLVAFGISAITGLLWAWAGILIVGGVVGSTLARTRLARTATVPLPQATRDLIGRLVTMNLVLASAIGVTGALLVKSTTSAVVAAAAGTGLILVIDGILLGSELTLLGALLLITALGIGFFDTPRAALGWTSVAGSLGMACVAELMRRRVKRWRQTQS